jgi:hypothetical protein
MQFLRNEAFGNLAGKAEHPKLADNASFHRIDPQGAESPGAGRKSCSNRLFFLLDTVIAEG